MYSTQNPPLVISSQPQKCVGNSLFEWVFTNNSSASSLVRIRKSTYGVTHTIDTTNTIGVNSRIDYGMTYGNGYIFIPSSETATIYRYSSDQDNPIGSAFTFKVNITNYDNPADQSFNTLLLYNDYLWCVPRTAGINHLVRLDVFSNLSTIQYNYTFNSQESDAGADETVSVYTGLTKTSSDGIAGAKKIFGFGGYIYTLKYGSSNTTIIKVSANIPRSSTGISTSGTDFSYNYYYFTTNDIRHIASDNVSYVWFANNTDLKIYRVSISDSSNYNDELSLLSNFASGLSYSISAMTYGVGYLWISGKNYQYTEAAVVQRDVVTDTTLRIITALPTTSYITSMDIYNQFLWMTDVNNATLLKMQVYIPCFKEDSKILCLNSQMKEEYIPIQNIRKGTLVKTLLNGFVPVDMIGKSVISNPSGDSRIKNRLYKCSVDKYPELFEDLYITGCHSILVDSLSDEQHKNTIDDLETIYITDKKYRLMAFLDDRAIPYNATGSFTIWHLALQNDDYYMNYGIFANGLLVESTSQRYMKELSGMELID